jgi:hypothetical protein
VDRLARSREGVWQIHDYKTNQKLPTQAEKDADSQLALYEIGLRRTWRGVERVELTWHFLRFDTSIVSTRTAGQLERLEADTLVTIHDIESRGRDEAGFPTRESGLCSWCDFQSICPVRKHLFATRELPPDERADETGVALVDRWTRIAGEQAELKARLEALEEQVGRIKQALADYARQAGLETVAGSERMASVRVTRKTVFPRRGEEPEQAAELEARLRETGWWGRLSALDRSALQRAWTDPAAPADLRGLLEPYARTEEDVDVRLRKAPRG